MKKIFALCAFALFILVGCSDESTSKSEKHNLETKSQASEKFDFYVLALSWSPSYCKALGSRANKFQCQKKRPKGFVVHGLWPQLEKGFINDCKTNQPRHIPRQLLSSMRDIIPADGLAVHEWRKHGTCSGLTQEQYFDTLRAAYNKIKFPKNVGGAPISPKVLEQRFMQANKNLPSDAISVTCDKRYIREVRICFNKDLKFRPCKSLERKSCRLPKGAMPR